MLIKPGVKQKPILFNHDQIPAVNKPFTFNPTATKTTLISNVFKETIYCVQWQLKESNQQMWYHHKKESQRHARSRVPQLITGLYCWLHWFPKKYWSQVRVYLNTTCPFRLGQLWVCVPRFTLNAHDTRSSFCLYLPLFLTSTVKVWEVSTFKKIWKNNCYQNK